MALGILSLYPLGSLLLVVVEFTQLRLVLMVRLIAIRLVWLLKGTLRFMVLVKHNIHIKPKFYKLELLGKLVV